MPYIVYTLPSTFKLGWVYGHGVYVVDQLCQNIGASDTKRRHTVCSCTLSICKHCYFVGCPTLFSTKAFPTWAWVYRRVGMFGTELKNVLDAPLDLQNHQKIMIIESALAIQIQRGQRTTQ